MADTKKLEVLEQVQNEETLEEALKNSEEPQTEFSAPKLQVETVVVYLDRAEVCRSFKAKLKTGQNELIVKDLSQSIDKDSIRVEGRGSATISEVSVQTKHLDENEAKNSGKRDELQKEMEKLENRKDLLTQKQQRVQKQRTVLDGFADNVI